ncbi:MAG: S10 family serine carboxypeptidase-like protein [Bacteroidota bacterium]
MRKVWILLLMLVTILASAQDNKSETKTWNTSDPPLVVTQHKVTIGGVAVSYTATTGYMVLREESGKPRAKIFFIAYTQDAVADISKRALTFSFNGGPGSSSVWLHMGALGPRRIEMTDFGGATKPPYKIIDNEFSWLDQTDLVFIDPVMTGYSRPEEGVEKKEFTGFTEDIESVGAFIHLYTTRFGRWSSPKFLAGESYGTTRAAGLAGHLQDRYGMYLNGLVLVQPF